LLATSALLFGVLGWLAAHTATDWAVGHSGHGLADGPAHHHLHLPAAALLVACLAGGSLFAIFAVAVLGRHPLAAGSPRSKLASARRSSSLSTASFVAAEFVEHAVTGQHEIPPIGVLLIGCVVHALMGAGSSMLWGWCVRDVLRAASVLRGGGPVCFGQRRLPVAARRTPALRTWRLLAMAGRAPPPVGCA
jgi:hypothetical protein